MTAAPRPSLCAPLRTEASAGTLPPPISSQTRPGRTQAAPCMTRSLGLCLHRTPRTGRASPVIGHAWAPTALRAAAMSGCASRRTEPSAGARPRTSVAPSGQCLVRAAVPALGSSCASRWPAWPVLARARQAEFAERRNGGPTKGVQLADGTLVMVVVDLSSPKPGFAGGGILSLRSKTHGRSWEGGQPRFVAGWSETSIAQLPDGRLLANARCGPSLCT